LIDLLYEREREEKKVERKKEMSTSATTGEGPASIKDQDVVASKIVGSGV
jgi:hypothetical protein